MLLDDDVVTDGEAKAGAFSGRLGRKERIEDLLLHLGRNASAIGSGQASASMERAFVTDNEIDDSTSGRNWNILWPSDHRFRPILRSSIDG